MGMDQGMRQGFDTGYGQGKKEGLKKGAKFGKDAAERDSSRGSNRASSAEYNRRRSEGAATRERLQREESERRDRKIQNRLDHETMRAHNLFAPRNNNNNTPPNPPSGGGNGGSGLRKMKNMINAFKLKQLHSTPGTPEYDNDKATEDLYDKILTTFSILFMKHITMIL